MHLHNHSLHVCQGFAKAGGSSCNKLAVHWDLWKLRAGLVQFKVCVSVAPALQSHSSRS